MRTPDLMRLLRQPWCRALVGMAVPFLLGYDLRLMLGSVWFGMFAGIVLAYWFLVGWAREEQATADRAAAARARRSP